MIGSLFSGCLTGSRRFAARSLLVFGSAAFVLLAGCSTQPQTDYSQVDLQSVGGVVTLDGSPLPNAVVTFESVADGSFSYAMTGADGSFTLQFDTVKKGCTPGQKLVRISTTRKILGLNTTEEGDGEGGEGESGAAEAVEQVPDCYSKKSQLKVEVTDTVTQFQLDLKSDCSTTGATL
ncbi:MAG: carboxypeptidase regulatory-like domain-containing protein [Planctomycetaceae bacterium]|nr:carboxypeptidase regulatory-like domain-containing protein [Planctomycetaceae bacterium]